MDDNKIKININNNSKNKTNLISDKKKIFYDMSKQNEFLVSFINIDFEVYLSIKKLFYFIFFNKLN